MNETIPLVIHATHEAGVKVGGIGAVLDGLLGAKAYNQRVQRSLLAGPLLGWDPVQMERLNSPRNRLHIRYSSLHAVYDGVDETIQQALRSVEQTFQVALLYGTRRFGQAEHEILLVDASNPDLAQVANFRYFVWEQYGIDGQRYSHDSEFNLYFSIAQPLFAGIKALEIDDGLAAQERVIVAHEWLGMPLVFAAQMNEPGRWPTAFYAHEMATARLLVEEHSGHDTRFYNALLQAQADRLPLEALFGDQSHYFKHAIIRQAARCENIFAVGDLVVDEMRFLGGPFQQANIDLVYNGIVATDSSVDERLDAKRRLQEYCRNLLGYTPDYVFTHVTRLVLSKGLWRDLRVMEHLDRMLAEVGKTAVLFVLSTSQPAGRRPEWVHAWEAQYGWPVGHRADNGDLLGPEVPYFFDGVEPFNRSARNSRVVLVNQFGWDRERCGSRMPAEMGFADIRRGSDVEFGQSIYEPFGIAQVEPLNFGAICCVSNVCGCVGFVKRVESQMGVPEQSPLVVADYVSLPPEYPLHSAWDALAIDQSTRDWLEARNAGDTARHIFQQLPTSREQMAEQLRVGSALAHGMSWDVVAHSYLLPGLRTAQSKI